MSTTQYKRTSHVYYITAWSVVDCGERIWVRHDTFSKNPEEALWETRRDKLYSARPDFEVKLIGYKIV